MKNPSLRALPISGTAFPRRRGTSIASIVAALIPTLAQAQELADPQGSGVVISAMQWLQGTLLGTVATLAAVIAVAVVGFMMLTGRINWRHGVRGSHNCAAVRQVAQI